MDYLEEVRKEMREEEHIIFYDYCKKCKRRHKMVMKPCLICEVYETELVFDTFTDERKA